MADMDFSSIEKWGRELCATRDAELAALRAELATEQACHKLTIAHQDAAYKDLAALRAENERLKAACGVAMIALMHVPAGHTVYIMEAVQRIRAALQEPK